MKIDLYSKTVLTIIAVASVGNLFRDAPVISSANAQAHAKDGVMLVEIVPPVGGLKVDVLNPVMKVAQANEEELRDYGVWRKFLR
jgi:hypothetical protein